MSVYKLMEEISKTKSLLKTFDDMLTEIEAEGKTPSRELQETEYELSCLRDSLNEKLNAAVDMLTINKA